ncbi:MAG: aminotransferase class IV [Proteobacteria bacterium]|nr:aminotransferase class IV [Pseudomonadota bacterium]
MRPALAPPRTLRYGTGPMLDGVVCLNGDFRPVAEARVSVLDRGFLYGDAAFEVMRTYGGAPFCEREHLERLARSCDRLGIRLPLDSASLSVEIRQTVERSGSEECYVRVVVSRGQGPVNLDPATARATTRVVYALPLAPPPATIYEQGIALSLIHDLQGAKGSSVGGAKVSNYLPNAMALREAKGRGSDEAAFVGPCGEVLEGSTSNVFAVVGGVLRTPPVSAGILAGVTRGLVLDLASERSLATVQGPLFPGDLYGAQEVFISSSVREIAPVVRVDDVAVGDGKPGPVTKELLRGYRSRARAASS